MQWVRFASVILVVLLTNSCGRPEHDPRTLIIAQITEPSNLDPAAFIHIGDLAIISEVYQRLVSQVTVDGHPTARYRGELAESWKISEDGRTYTFSLQKDQCFDDGSVVDAHAVKWSLERIKHVNRSAAQFVDWVDRVEVIDQWTVRIYSSRPFAAAMATLAYSSTVIMNPAIEDRFETEEELKQWLSTHSAGSGPYRVRSWDRGNRLVLEPNTCNQNDQPFFSKVVFKSIADPASRRIQLQKGDVDISLVVASTNAHYYEKLDNVKLTINQTQNQPGFWIVNTNDPVLSDVRVRRAIALGIDYEGLINGVMDGKAQRVTSLLPEGVIAHIPGLLDARFDPEEARELLRQAGYPEGVDLKLLIGLTGPVSETLQSFMSDIGVRLTLEIVASVSFYDRINSGDFDLAYTADYVDFLDPWAILGPWYHTDSITNRYNMAKYSNPEVDRLLDLGDASPKEEVRVQAYQQAQEIIARDLPYIHLFSGSRIHAARSDIAGLQISPLVGYRLNLSRAYRLAEDTAK